MTAPKFLLAPATLLVLAALSAGCKKTEDTTHQETMARADTAPQVPRVRGTVESYAHDTLVVTTSDGPVRVAITSPLKVYTRVNTDLSHVTENSFVGVTSVAQPDGTEQATEVHIFPEDLRGTGEGSYPMQQPPSGGQPSTMTNGTVTPPKADGGSTMTNGTVKAKANPSSLTVQYKEGSKTITIPAGVTVTELVATGPSLAPGETVTVLVKKNADGTLSANQVILAAPTAPTAPTKTP